MTRHHLPHLEELIILNGSTGARNAITLLQKLKNQSDLLNISAKFDGSPAIIFGIHPFNDKFFVSLKSFADPCFTTQDIILKYTENDLQNKLLCAFKYLKKYVTSGMYQGDILFTDTSKIDKTIDGTEYITFTPNAITYAIPKNSKLAKQIENKQFGIAVHTEFNLLDFLIESKHNIDFETIDTNDVWAFNCETELKGLTISDIDNLQEILSQLGKTLNWISGEFLKECTTNKQLNKYMLEYGNYLVKHPEAQNPVSHYQEFKRFVKHRILKNIEQLKTPEGKANRVNQYYDFAKSISKYSHCINYTIQFQQLISKAKQIILYRHDVADIHTFCEDAKTQHEGLVVTYENNPVKIINRNEFSLLNFKAIKQWLNRRID